MVKNFMEMQIVVGVICYLLPYIYEKKKLRVNFIYLENESI